jgi:hypothetical protein
LIDTPASRDILINLLNIGCIEALTSALWTWNRRRFNIVISLIIPAYGTKPLIGLPDVTELVDDGTNELGVADFDLRWNKAILE